MKNVKLMLLGLTGITAVHAQDLTPDRVPQAIRASFQQNYAQATDVEWEQEYPGYSVAFEVDRMDHEIWYDKSGAILKSEQELTVDELPQGVHDALLKAHKDFTIEEVEKLDIKGKITYTVELEKGWFQEREVVVDATGKILSDLED
ncbi:putative PepSY-like beta-lactamase-inhibitor [Leeuwenhoekiella aestuarii]|uniref:Putative PepSY-like beta-lactamase-inhibitor n=1 Tax=Leeuwenhoekiella aestuarii TaxID=2249426 RepID=A0A4Q0NRB0_9FLAO|nr:PepSY-like domain-containing protein [Leeuwenhoekiella aestuarii]RXG13226.1 putative PepSY-like beta-lactamase-inhibitor [Leeuwenhoekiella aestuarii]RXG15037.1 putative PepSY-like beta-lactamase-inhibitor [Leeuwenhoekiella aestuarii]